MMDVAARSGVSQSSVSMVLNNAGGVRVSEATRERVRRAAEELGYRVWRRSPVGSGSIRTLGVLVDDVAQNPLSITAIDAARKRAWENDCVLAVIPLDPDRHFVRRAVELLLAQRLVGVIYQSFFTRELVLPKRLRTTPVILLNAYTKDPNVPFIVPDHAEGAENGAARLIAAGHRRIGFINGSTSMEAARDRLAGYERALTKAGISIDPALIRDGDWRMSRAEQETMALLNLAEPPTAIFCASDRMAIGCYEGLKTAGLRVPDDISVLGFDDDPMAAYVTPPLSTVRVPHAQMGELAVDYLVARAEGEVVPETASHHIHCRLVERSSIADIGTRRNRRRRKRTPAGAAEAVSGRGGSPST